MLPIFRRRRRRRKRDRQEVPNVAKNHYTFESFFQIQKYLLKTNEISSRISYKRLLSFQNLKYLRFFFLINTKGNAEG